MLDINNNTKEVMIVDDDTDIREAIAQVLEYEGYKVISAANGKEGILQLKSNRPQLILLDLMMPVMNGWEFKAELDSKPEVADIPVVILSAAGNLSEKSASIGVCEFLSKPVQVESLLNIVKKYCH